MQKMMFNDQYGLTEAVLNGKKTQTRRVFNEEIYGDLTIESNPVRLNEHQYGINSHSIRSHLPKYKIGEVVAVAQSYKNIYSEFLDPESKERGRIDDYCLLHSHCLYEESKGWNNKMFVCADLMPHQIQITKIRLERLQDISDEDCIAEGIYKGQCGSIYTHFMDAYYFKGNIQPYCTPRDAYEELIDRVSGKGKWENNPYVFVYEFRLIE